MTMSNNPFVCFSELLIQREAPQILNLTLPCSLLLFYLTCCRQARDNGDALTLYARRQFILSNEHHNKLRFSNGCKHSAFETR